MDFSGFIGTIVVLILIIFLIMVFGWFTEKSFYNMGIYPVRLGIGVIAVAGAIGYILTGVVNWRDYQEKVDWGVVWLYAGAIIFGRTLDQTGAAYWLARTAIGFLARFGMESGLPLMIVSNGLTSILTNGYSFPSSHTMVSLDPAVDLPKKA